MGAHRTVTILGETRAVLGAMHQLGAVHGDVDVDGWVVTSTDTAEGSISLLAQHPDAQFEPPSADVVFASDLVVIALSAERGIANTWQGVWHMVEAWQRPTLVIITDLDQARADIDEMTAIARRVFDIDDAIQVIALPALDDDDMVGGTVDLIDLMIHDASVDPPSIRAADPEHIALLAERRSELAFTLAARHEAGDMAATVHAGLTPDAQSMAAAVVHCTAEANFIPVLPLGAGPRYVGAEHITSLIAEIAEHTPPRLPVIDAVPPRTTIPHAATAREARCAQVILSDDAHSVVRVWSGTLREANEPGGLVVLPDPQQVGTVIADPPGSLQISLPAT